MLMRSIGLEGEIISLVMSGFINIMQLLAVLPALFLLDSVGRKPLLKGILRPLGQVNTELTFSQLGL